MSALGPGCRVFIGWCAQHQRHGPIADRAICRTGTLTDGPFPPGASICGWILGQTGWLVSVDDVGTLLVSEWLLRPIDGGEPDAQTEDRDAEVTA